MEALISSMMASGCSLKRPPHILLLICTYSTEVPPTMTAPDDAAKRHARRRLAVVGAGTLAGIALGLAAVYGISALLGNRQADAACAPAVETAKRIAPFAHGEVAAVALATKPLRVPDLEFRDASGAPRKLSDWSGRTVLFNLWATWCVP